MTEISTIALPGRYRAMAFSGTIQRLASNGRNAEAVTRSASPAEARAALAHVRQRLPELAGDDVVSAVMARHPDVVQLLGPEADSGEQSFLAFLPLNEAGLRTLLSGSFDYANPDLSLLCRKDETPQAIYIWLVFAPGKFLTMVLALDPVLGRLAPSGCPLFARAANGKAAALFGKIGFVAANIVYPGAPNDLLGLPPVGGFPPVSPKLSGLAPSMNVRVARTMDDIVKSFSVRSATYIAEQLCPFDEEFDGNDFCATHLIGEIEGEPAGCIRVRFFAGFVKIERLAVRQEYRTSKLAFRLVREALHYARRKGYRQAYGHSRTDLTRFWGLFGFRPIEGRHTFIFSDVEYVELAADLREHEHSICIGADPYVLIRPEGEWDTPGPLDRSAERSHWRTGA